MKLIVWILWGMVIILMPVLGFCMEAPPVVEHGYRSIDAYISGGIASPGAEEDKSNYYGGFASGPTFQVGIRYFPSLEYFTFKHIPEEDKRAGRYFLSLSYTRTIPRLEEEPYCYPSICQGNADLTIHQYACEMGITTPIIRQDSYAYLLMGITFFRNSFSDDFHSLTNSRIAMRLGLGSVIGLSSRFGVVVQAMADIIMNKNFTDEERQASFINSNPFGLLIVNVGLSYEIW